jgi:gluconate 2-dehydrogenase subunit 3-like protein
MTEPLGAQALETLRAAVDTIVPADDWPAGWDGGVAALLDREGDAVLAWARPSLERATERLDAAARQRGTRAFAKARVPARGGWAETDHELHVRAH